MSLNTLSEYQVSIDEKVEAENCGKLHSGVVEFTSDQEKMICEILEWKKEVVVVTIRGTWNDKFFGLELKRFNHRTRNFW